MTDTPSSGTTAQFFAAPLRHPERLAKFVVCWIVLAWAVPASATTFVAMTEEALAAQSVAVVTGKVKRIESVREPETNGADVAADILLQTLS